MRVRKYIRFLFCSSPDPAIVQNLFADSWKFLFTKFLINLHFVPYFDPTKKSVKKNIISFRGIPYLLRSIRKYAHAHNVFFGFGYCWNVGLMKSKLVKVKSFYNYFIHYFQFLGHPNVMYFLLYFYI